MKKTLWIIGLVALALGVFGVGVVFAQDVQPPVTRGPMANGSYGAMHDYVEKALAEKLGIAEADIESELASGKTMYQIALDNGTAEADIPALLADVHAQAFDKAVADGVLTREQADFMLQRMADGGYGFGNCPMNGNGGSGYGRGHGHHGGINNGSQFGPGMMGGRWSQIPPTAQP